MRRLLLNYLAEVREKINGTDTGTNRKLTMKLNGLLQMSNTRKKKLRTRPFFFYVPKNQLFNSVKYYESNQIIF